MNKDKEKPPQCLRPCRVSVVVGACQYSIHGTDIPTLYMHRHPPIHYKNPHSINSLAHKTDKLTRAALTARRSCSYKCENKPRVPRKTSHISFDIDVQDTPLKTQMFKSILIVNQGRLYKFSFF